ncbi:MAG: hypothetical protein J6X78_02835 [Treponema sp.]|nr:hypothetical protein [Treponema sp.]
MKYIYFIVLMSIAAVIALIILIISIKERVDNKNNNTTSRIQNQKDLDGVSGQELYGTWADEKKKYKSFIRKVKKDS